MARFPLKEPDVIALSQAMVSGVTADGGVAVGVPAAALRTG
jgi:hypothetical protein